MSVVVFLERIPAVEDIHVIDATYDGATGDTDRALKLPITLWFDEFQHNLSEDESEANGSGRDDKLQQLESIATAYLDGLTVSLHPTSDDPGTHVLTAERSQTHNPLHYLKRRWDSLRWRWHVWNANTHVSVTPLPASEAVDYHV